MVAMMLIASLSADRGPMSPSCMSAASCYWTSTAPTSDTMAAGLAGYLADSVANEITGQMQQNGRLTRVLSNGRCAWSTNSRSSCGHGRWR